MDSKFQIDKFAEAACLEEVKDSISRNPSLDKFKSILVDDRFLLHFVRGKKYNAKTAIKALENYFYIRQKKYNATFKGIRPSGNPVLSARILTVLKARDAGSGSLIVVAYASRLIPSNVTHEDCFRAGVLLVEEAWNFPELEHHGYILIVDATGFNLSHLRMWKNPFQVHKLFDIFLNNMPLRYREIHLVNMSPLYAMFLNTMYYLFPKKMKERLRFYGENGKELKKFHESISLEILPKSLGGKLDEDEAFDLEFEKRILGKEDYYRRFSEYDFILNVV